MLTAGVDLAAESKGTALAVIEWDASRATLLELHLGVGDEQIVAVAGGMEKIGIDCAFGWPDEFVRFVTSHAAGERDPAGPEGGMAWRRTLAYRETDRDARLKTGRWPLSVSTDRLGLTAMRCAGLLARLDASGVTVDRAGSGAVVEVYPGASLRLWGMDTRGYRTDPASRRRLLADLCAAAPWLDLAGQSESMVASADAFDAVVASLAARNAALGGYLGPPPELLERARREGWIALPSGPIGDLLGGAGVSRSPVP
jgi:predicted nuclease with RNAse H fold